MRLAPNIGLLPLLAALCIGPSAAIADPVVPPFYQSVMTMKAEGRLGELIKQEKIDTPVAGAQAWRIAYISSDVAGNKTIATGIVVAPTGDAPAGGRPVISWSHGTTGTAQNCSPSQVLSPARPLNLYFLVGGDSYTDYGLPSLEEFIKEGYVVVGTDYQGLGGGGRHQYAVANSNGRDAINIVRAIGAIKEVGAGKKAVAIGWSQGGGSTLGAASQPEYISQTGTALDGIEFVGFVAMAPNDIAVDTPDTFDDATAKTFITQFAKKFSSNNFDFAHFSMNLWGIQAAYPDKLKMTDIFTDDGAKALNEIYYNKCIHPSADTINYTYGTTYETLVRPDLQNTLAWAQALKDISANPTVKPSAPVKIYWGNHDTAMPPVMGEIYRKKVCAIGGNVGRMELPGDQTHFSTPGVSAQFYLPWIKDRFAGKPADNGCATN